MSNLHLLKFNFKKILTLRKLSKSNSLHTYPVLSSQIQKHFEFPVSDTLIANLTKENLTVMNRILLLKSNLSKTYQ